MLELIANHHKLWISMVVSFGCDKESAEDVVQSMYLRIHKYVKNEKRIMYGDDDINKFFIYITLKNMFMDMKKSNNKYSYLEMDDEDVSYEPIQEDVNIEMEYAHGTIIRKIQDEMSTWHRYDRILSEKYLKSDYSLRDIASGSGISLTSIFNSMKTNKQILKEKFQEDYEDFKNGDYHLI